MSALRVITCGSFPADAPSPAHDLVRAFRAGDAAAFAAVLELVSDRLAVQDPSLATADGVTVVAMPGHLAGRRLGPLERLSRALAATHPGWRAAAALARVADGPEGKDAGRRDAQVEAGSLRWADVPGEGPVLVLDDVVRSGATLSAAWLAAPSGLRERLVALAAYSAVR